jgi:uncharacterized protein
MDEIPQFFPNREGKRLFGVTHAAGGGRRKLALVYCAPLFEEKLWGHRVAVNFARFMAARGVAVLRFDYFGDGESEGLFEQASVSSRMRDIEDAAALLRDRTAAERVFAVGLCYGATLALSVALSSSQLDGVVAWAPVMDGEKYLGDLLRASVAAQMVVHRKVLHDREALVAQIRDGRTVNVEGYEIGNALYSEMCNLNLPERLRSAAKPMLIQQLSPTDAVESQYASFVGSPPPNVHFQKVREMRFWTPQKSVFPLCDGLFEGAAAWLESVAVQ